MTARLAADEELPPTATSAGRARRLLRDAVGAPGNEELLDAAQLAISEIVTNALVHAGTPMRLRVLLAGAALRVELTDGSPRMPRRRDFDPAAATGRGLVLLEELVTRWGVRAAPTGKVVWFEITDDVSLDASRPEERGRPEGQESVAVELPGMPLLMHKAWQEHASALLRELMLVRLEDRLSALADHAGASDALGVLVEQVPVPDVGFEPESVMANATEPEVSAERLVVQVPRDSISSFETLDVLLDEAVALAGQGRLLAPTTQPELEEMRRWICEQVRSQAAGGSPAPWRSVPDAPPPARAPLPENGWHEDEVTSSGLALLAADDTNRIVAVSRSTLDLLGYERAEQLIGRRLLSIIPQRFHQAHVAGFTLFLVNGRAPLLGQQVTVPVQRADGGEVEQRLLIRSRQLPGGRHVFVAEFGG